MNSIKYAKTLPELIDILKKSEVPRSEYSIFVDRFLQYKARKKYVPIAGSFELTPLCNFDCKMCYVHLTKNQFCETNLIPVKVWKSLVKQAHDLGMIKATLTGGECLTYPGFDEIYLYLIELGIIPAVLTNGYLIDSERIDFWIHNRPRNVQVSLYGSSDDDYEKVTGRRCFDRIYNNISMLRDANIPVTISLTPNQYMQKDIRSLLETAESLRVPYHINSSLLTPRQITNRLNGDVNNEQYLEIYKISNEIKNGKNTSKTSSILPAENTECLSEAQYGLRCGGGKSAFIVLHTGSMSPCAGLDDVKTNPLEVGFETAWNELNHLVDNYLIPRECSDCVYNPICLTCPAVHKDAKPGHCNRVICERIKLLVKEGILPVPQKEVQN